MQKKCFQEFVTASQYGSVYLGEKYSPIFKKKLDNDPNQY